MSDECTGKVALVTGASRGIGAAIAERLASAGASVAIVARSLNTHPPELPGTLAECAARIERRGGRVATIQVDVTDHDSRVRLVEECRRALGPIDVLVNNAAFGRYKPFEALSARDFERTIEANLRAPFELCQLVLPDMKRKRRGWIVNVSSATAVHPQGPPFAAWEQSGGHMLYAASKAALERMTTGLAAELADNGVGVNALAPVAAVITPGVKAMGIDQWIEPSMVEPVEAMAEATLALCASDPSKLTGRILYSTAFLTELGRPVRTLDGSEVLSS